ncbi:hypothetical protein D3C86_1734170 [compost metagenome]
MQTIPVLTNSVHIFSIQIPILKILQHSSTFLGGLVIAYALFKLPVDKKITGQFNIKYWSILTVLTLTIIAIRLISGLDYKLYGHLIATIISAGIISLTLTPWLSAWKK